MSILRRVLNLGAREPSSARERLRTALANRDHAQAELAKAKEAVSRVENVLDAARAADRRVREAERAAAEAATKWAAAGADPADAEHERLRAAIAVAERTAEQAWFAARGAEAGIGKARETESQCASRLNDAQREVKEAIGLILYEKIGPPLELEIAARQYERARLERVTLLRLLDPARPGWNDDATHQANEAARLIRGELQRCEIRPLSERTMKNGFAVPSSHTPAAVLEGTAQWRTRAQLLRENPDAV
jgi:hypothetical protein